MNNLAPGQYKLRAEKAGYQPWEKVVLVTPFSVREIRDVILLPDPLIQKEVAVWNIEENLERASISPTGQYAVIALYNTITQKRSLLFFNAVSKKILAQFPISTAPEEITWNTDENAVLFKTGGQKTEYTLMAFSNTPPRRTALFEKSIILSGNAGRRLTPTEIKKIRFGDTTDNFVFLTNAGALLFWNTATTSTATLAEGVEEFEILGDEVFFIAKNGFAARRSLRDSNTMNLGRKGYVLSESPIKVIRSRDGDIFFKDGAGGLFFSSHESAEEFKLIETGIKNIAMDSDEEKLFFMKQSAVGVFYLKDNSYQPFQKRGDAQILFQSSDTAFLNAAWYQEDDAHIILNTSSGIFLLDGDTRGGPRIAELNSTPAKTIFWNQQEKKLYLIYDTGIKTIAIE